MEIVVGALSQSVEKRTSELLIANEKLERL